MVQQEFVGAIEAHPALTGVIPFPRTRFRRLWASPSRIASVINWYRRLGRVEGPWDLAIDCQGLARTGLMLWGSRGRRRVGDRAAREAAWLACTDRVRVPGGIHEVDRMLALVAAVDAAPVHDARLYVPEEGLRSWASCRARMELDPGPYVVLATTSRWVSKAWPRQHWVELAQELVRETPATWVALPGAPSEAGEVAATASAMKAEGVPACPLAGRTDVAAMMAMIDQAALTISNDSAALHMAMGLGERCVGLFGPTDPAIVGPWRRPDLAIRASLMPGERPAYRDDSLGSRIMQRLPVDAVVERALDVLRSGA